MTVLPYDPFRHQTVPLDGVTVQRMAAALAGASRRAFAEAAATLAARGALAASELRQWAEATGVDAQDEATAWPASVAAPPLPDRDALAELAASALTGPYRLWACLIAHETALFAYWSYASAHATPEGRQIAEGLARAALDRAGKARPARRRAYQAARGGVAEADPARAAERYVEDALRQADFAKDEATLTAAQARSTTALAVWRTRRDGAPPK